MAGSSEKYLPVMKTTRTSAIFLVLVLALTAPLSACAPADAAAGDTALRDTALRDTAAYMLKTVEAPEVGSIGGEWAVIGLARSGCDVPDAYYADYYENVEAYVRECDGILHERKYTEYSRVILGLTAAGYDPRDVGGYDLTAALGDFENTVWQGINGPIWALIALDSRDYPIPANRAAKTQATRELYLEEILRRQLPDGGWNLTAGADGEIAPGERADPDITGMALQALAKYQDKPEVRAATDRALSCMAETQGGEGGYTSWGTPNSESVAQVLVAICELGISPDDERFVKNGLTLEGSLLSYKNADGSFRHTADGSGNSQMSTEQALYALAAAQRARDGGNSLYRMSDAPRRAAGRPEAAPGAMVIDPATGKDIYQTDPVPEGRPLPVEPANAVLGDARHTVTLTVRCDTILANMDRLDKEKHELVPADGVIFPAAAVTFREGESVFDVLWREMQNAKIHLEFVNTPLYNSAYIEGINNLYEFDAGELSGWMYKVNGWFPNYGCSRYQLRDGDEVEWVYTCDLGRDVGEFWLGGQRDE
ncbi:MAG: DUF4430 domain-containing protein [Gracilibacteraceae bacterium]|jgi:hypothetical protein|nr:DUF4430 domain-containing protein [Gracilibacteraceae bacterium]